LATASSFSISVSLVAACSPRRTSVVPRDMARLMLSAFSRLVALSTVNQSRQAPLSGSQERLTVDVSPCGVMTAYTTLWSAPNAPSSCCNNGTAWPSG